MPELDIPALVERIREHRFDGYTENMLADEIERFRAGPGAAGLGEAVDALGAIATALADTDETLRTELEKLGVEWQSDAGEQAGSAVVEQARFSRDANDKVNTAAQLIFAQGEAFNRTLHKLPDAETLRAGAGGYDFGDTALRLVGFETDHVEKVAESREARQQALEALNAYARDSGEYLSGTEELSPPQALQATMAPRVPESVDAGGGPVDVTFAAGAAHAPVPGPAPAPPPAAPAASSVSASGAAYHAPTPPMGVPAQPQAPAARATGRSVPAPSQPTAPSSTSPSASPSAPAASAGGFVGGGTRPGGRTDYDGRPAPGTSPAPPGPQGQGPAVGARPGGPPVGNVPGKVAVPGAPGGGGTQAPPPVGGGVVGKVAGPGAGGGPTETPLGKGRYSGAAPPGPTAPPGTSGGSGFASAPRGGVSANQFGAGAAAIGAGGVAGALSGEEERRGRGVGRSAPGAARSPHQLPIGDLPEEEARAQRNSERLSPGRDSQHRGLLEKAAAQDEEDADHVRRWGVDDSDLFTDQRTVAPDVIGDDGSEGRR